MKNYYVLIGLLFSIATYGQQTMVFQETFETGIDKWTSGLSLALLVAEHDKDDPLALESDSHVFVATVALTITSDGGGATASRNVAENTTDVTNVSATATNGDAIKYGIDDSSPDASKFVINESTGALSFIDRPDFENPGSSINSNVYTVVVKANDNTSCIRQAITVNITNVVDDSQSTVVFQETFETGSAFTASEDCHDDPPTYGYDYFTRTTSGAGDGGAHGTKIRNKNVYLNPEGSYFWAAHDTDGPPCTMAVQTLEKTGIDISGRSNLSLVLLVAEDDEDDPTKQKWDNNTHVFVEVKIDGGSYTKVLQFSAGADREDSQNDMEPELDTNLDGTGDGAAITDTFQEFKVNLTGVTGSTLDLKITFDELNGSGKDFAVDNIRIVEDGTMSVDENTVTSSVQIYPNPSGDFLLLPNITETEKYSIYTISGKEVLKGTISANKKIDIRNLTNGLYFLKLGNIKTLKFLKK